MSRSTVLTSASASSFRSRRTRERDQMQARSRRCGRQRNLARARRRRLVRRFPAAYAAPCRRSLPIILDAPGADLPRRCVRVPPSRAIAARCGPRPAGKPDRRHAGAAWCRRIHPGVARRTAPFLPAARSMADAVLAARRRCAGRRALRAARRGVVRVQDARRAVPARLRLGKQPPSSSRRHGRSACHVGVDPRVTELGPHHDQHDWPAFVRIAPLPLAGMLCLPGAAPTTAATLRPISHTACS